MKFLLDTHLLLWWMDDSPALPAEGRSLVADPANTIFVSSVSLWEIWLKQSVGKLHVPPNFAEKLEEEAFESLPLTAAQTQHVSSLPWIHRDPFDRMLVAQAQAEGLTLLTADQRVAQYGEFVRLVR